MPLRGVSAISIEGGIFHDPDADTALFSAVRETTDTAVVDLIELDTHINDPAFAEAMVEYLEAADPE